MTAGQNGVAIPEERVQDFGDMAMVEPRELLPIDFRDKKRLSSARTARTLFLISMLLTPGLVAAQMRCPEPRPPVFPEFDREGAWSVTTPKQQNTTRPDALSAEFPTTEWLYHKTPDGTHPDGVEQQMVWLMNRARHNPPLEGIWLAHLRQSNVQSTMNYFGVLREVLMEEFQAIATEAPSAFDVRLYLAAKNHCDYLISIDGQNHTNQFDRITDQGFHYTSARGSVYSYNMDGVYGHAGFNIDWGWDDGTGMQSGRGHRAGVMGNYANIGVACVPENDPTTGVGPLVTTINYANASVSYQDHYNRFIVGTVWSDANSNAMYDPGEGIGNVTVTPDHGTFFAVTGAAGGFAIPVDAGDYTLTFSGGNLQTPVMRVVSVADVSALVEWVDRQLSSPLAATISHDAAAFSFSLMDQKKGLPYMLVKCSNLVDQAWTWSGVLPDGFGSTLLYEFAITDPQESRLFLSLFGWGY